ncbi:MAG: tRNA glutamyl-Q(34) synthetase GluQRS [Dyella sp.]
MSYRGRFAPSPTGTLHPGSLVAALGSWLCARHAGGRWLLRIDDIDPPRERAGAAAAILAALPQFGLLADEPPLWQSQRSAAYQHAFAHLDQRGLMFPCWCSRSDLAAADGVHRDGRCVAPADPHRAPAWRVRVPADCVIRFDDALHGPQAQPIGRLGDFVIRRVEGYAAYHLACVVDDAYQHITEVVRGSDLLDSCGRQIYLQRQLGLPTPCYRHLPLVLAADGSKLSKSSDAPALLPAQPLPALRQALSLLGVPKVDADNVPELLEQALARFDPARG